MGDLGGISEFLMTISGFFVAPYVSHMFLMKACEKFFIVDQQYDGLVDVEKRITSSRKVTTRDMKFTTCS